MNRPVGNPPCSVLLAHLQTVDKCRLRSVQTNSGRGLRCCLPGHGLGLGLQARHWCPRRVLCFSGCLSILTRLPIKFSLGSLPEGRSLSWIQVPVALKLSLTLVSLSPQMPGRLPKMNLEIELPHSYPSEYNCQYQSAAH